MRQWHVDDTILQLMLAHLPRHLSDMIDALEDLENSSLAERKRLTRAWASKQIKTMRQQKQAVLPSGCGEQNDRTHAPRHNPPPNTEP